MASLCVLLYKSSSPFGTTFFFLERISTLQYECVPRAHVSRKAEHQLIILISTTCFLWEHELYLCFYFAFILATKLFLFAGSNKTSSCHGSPCHKCWQILIVLLTGLRLSWRRSSIVRAQISSIDKFTAGWARVGCLVGGSESWGMTTGTAHGPWPLFSGSLCLLDGIIWAAFVQHTLLAWCFCLGVSQRVKPLKLWAKVNLSSFKLQMSSILSQKRKPVNIRYKKKKMTLTNSTNSATQKGHILVTFLLAESKYLS